MSVWRPSHPFKLGVMAKPTYYELITLLFKSAQMLITAPGSLRAAPLLVAVATSDAAERHEAQLLLGELALGRRNGENAYAAAMDARHWFGDAMHADDPVVRVKGALGFADACRGLWDHGRSEYVAAGIEALRVAMELKVTGSGTAQLALADWLSQHALDPGDFTESIELLIALLPGDDGVEAAHQLIALAERAATFGSSDSRWIGIARTAYQAVLMTRGDTTETAWPHIIARQGLVSLPPPPSATVEPTTDSSPSLS